jgi:hypothetical protein
MSRTLSRAHNVVHILSGLATLYVGFAGSMGAVRGLGFSLGLAYALLAVVGVVAPGIVVRWLGHPAQVDTTALAADNLLHVLMAGAFFIVALGTASPRRTSAITRLDLP